MRALSLTTAVRLGMLVGIVVAGTPYLAESQQQEVALSSRAPKFLVAMKSNRPPVEITPGGNALLRQVVSLQLARPSIGSLLAEIERQTSIRFGFSRDVLPANRTVALSADRITVGAALLSILMDTGVDVIVSPDGKMALVDRHGQRRLAPGSISGRVTNSETGAGIGDVEVFLESTEWRTMTDTTGAYRLPEVAPGAYTLTVRQLGYAKQSRQVAVRENQDEKVDFSLDPVAVKLDELVTTATGQQRRRDIGNAITTINADSVLDVAPTRDLTDLLDNRVPGLTVQNTSGAPGDPARLRLRGIGSVLRSNDPVVIVDGVRIYAAQAEGRSGNLTNQFARLDVDGNNFPAPSPLDQIDPNIIEKIEVLNGPSAATLYGADAANGVIVITTKKGQAGPTRWSARASHGRTRLPGEWPEGFYNWGGSIYDDQLRLCSVADLTCATDSLVRFQALNDPNLTILDQGRLTALSLTASGGNQGLTYSVTGSYSDETGVVKLPAFEEERFRNAFSREPPDWMTRPNRLEVWSVSSSIRALLGPSADVTLTTTVSRKEQQRSKLETYLPTLAGMYVDPINGIYYTPGTDLDVGFGSAGGLASGLASYFLVPDTTYLGAYYTRTTAGSIAFTSGLGANWRPRPWFTASAQAGVNVVSRDDEAYLPSGLSSATDSGAIAQGRGSAVTGTFNVQGTVRKPLRWGFTFETSIGANLLMEHTGDVITSSDALIPGTTTPASDSRLRFRNPRLDRSVYGWYIEPRFTSRRWSLSTGLRLDGGSAYGGRVSGIGGGGLLGLPKLNGSWVISEEPWFPFTSLFSSLRLRGAYGQAQRQPGPADRLRLYQYSTLINSTVDLISLGNTELRPERTTEFEGGFDADLLDDRLGMEFTVYQQTTIDALLNMNLPGSVNGGGTVLTNIGNVRNRGVTLTLRATPVQLPALTWSAQLLHSRNTNKLIELGRGVLPNPTEGLVEGYPLRSRWARPIIGYADVNGNGVLEPTEILLGDSLAFMGNLLPDRTTSLSTNVGLFGGAVGITAAFKHESGGTQVNSTARRNWVFARGIVDPAAPLGEQAAWLATTYPEDPTDFGLMQNVTTLRFQTLSIDYRAPTRIARLLRAQQLIIAVQGHNLGLLHSTYEGKDPDVSAWTPGEAFLDGGQLPQPRTWQVALSLRY